MANVVISPNMNLPVPVPTSDPGPDWAQQLYNCLYSNLDQHDHSPGKGVQITPAGLNLNADVSLQDNNLTNARSVRMQPQVSILTQPTDIGCISVIGNELFYNDVTGGHMFPLTNNGSVAGSSGSISGLTGTASASFSAGTFLWLRSTGVRADMDAATYILRYPGTYPTPAGNYINIQAPASLSGGYAFTLPTAAPGATSFLTMDSSGNLAASIATVGGITGTNIAASVALSGSPSVAGNLGLTGMSFIEMDQPSAGRFRFLWQYKAASLIVANGQLDENTVLRTVRGYVNGSAATIISGGGFTVTRNGVGDYTIGFENAFADDPSVVCTAIEAGAGTWTAQINTLSSSLFRVRTVNSGGFADTFFTFQAVGALF